MKKVIGSTEKDGILIDKSQKENNELMSYPDAYVFMLIDCSGSMINNNKLQKAKKGAIKYASEAIERGYAIGIISFSDYPVLQSKRQIRNIAQAETTIQQISIQGGTALAPAIEKATELLKGLSGTQVIFIVTDGYTENTQATIRAAGRAKEKGIYIKTLGTPDADRELLKKLSSTKKFVLKVKDEDMDRGIEDAASLLPPIPEK